MSCHVASAVGRIFTRPHRRIYAFFNARYTVGRVTPNSRASSAFGSPASTRLLISATCYGLRAGLRPLYFPAFFASAIPSAWRSRIMARSNSANEPKMPSIKSARGSVVSFA